MTTVPRAELTGTYVLDPVHTQIGFVARHAMITKVRGAFREFEGTVHLDGADVERSSLTVTIKVDSIDTRNERRDSDLRANQFLDAPNYPDITFTSTGVRLVDDTHVDVTGDLTVKGTTRPVTIPFEFQGTATDPMGNFRIGFEGSTEISRSDFGVTANMVLESGGVLVGDKIVLEIEVSAVKQP